MALKIKKKRQMKVMIPTASMADIAFLLLIFFMVTTVFKKDKGLRIELPTAATTERLVKQRGLAAVWVNKYGKITVDDNFVRPKQIVPIMRRKIAEEPGLIVLIKSDKNAKYGVIEQVMDALKEAQAYRVVFVTKKE